MQAGTATEDKEDCESQNHDDQALAAQRGVDDEEDTRSMYGRRVAQVGKAAEAVEPVDATELLHSIHTTDRDNKKQC